MNTYRASDLRLREPGRLRGDEGSAIAEAALVFPLLVGLLCGLIDSGIGLRDRQLVQATLRNAARVGAAASNYGQYNTADQYGLSTIWAGLGTVPNLYINRVVIFRNNPTSFASAPSNVTPAICRTTATIDTGVGITNSTATPPIYCNIYSNAQIKATSFTSSVSGSACSSSAGWDRWWCPATRARLLTDNSNYGPDYFGMYVNITYTPMTRFFSKSITVEDTISQRIEPYLG